MSKVKVFEEKSIVMSTKNDGFDDKYNTEMDYITGKGCMDVYRFVMAYCHLEKMAITARNLCAFADSI